jgi:uncharacterized membrane protein
LPKGFAVASHAVAAIAALLLGAVQLAAPKGTLPHRTLGYVWAGLMLYIAASGFWIHELQVWGRWSPIHLLSILVPRRRTARRLARASPRGDGAQARHDRALRAGARGDGLIHALARRVMHAVLFGS